MNSLPTEQDGNTKAQDPNSAPGVLLKLDLSSNPNLLCAVRGTVERLTESFAFSGEESRAVVRAVDEALTNIIRHTYGGKPDQPIQASFRRVLREPNDKATEGLEILLCDQGPAIDKKKLRGRELSDVKPGGLGLHFIQQSMDVVEFKRVDGTNQLRMVKYASSPKQLLST